MIHLNHPLEPHNMVDWGAKKMKADSSLVSVVIYSPNNSGKRVYPLTRISVHCAVGQCIAYSAGMIFANPDFEASSNYGIGKDGSIGQ